MIKEMTKCKGLASKGLGCNRRRHDFDDLAQHALLVSIIASIASTFPIRRRKLHLKTE